MIGLSEWLTFLGASILITLSPGPDNLLIIQQGIQLGRRASVPLALGMVSGVSVHILLAALGIAALIYASGVAYSIIQVLGGAYLLFVAWSTFRNKGGAAQSVDCEVASMEKSFGRGFLMNVLNPKVGVFFLAFLPQFVNAGEAQVRLKMVLFGLGFMAQAYLIFLGIALFASTMGHWTENQIFRNLLRYVSSAVMAGLGLSLFIEFGRSIA